MKIEEKIVKRFVEIQKKKLEIHLAIAKGSDQKKQQEDFKKDKDIQLYLHYINANPKKVWEEIIKKAKNSKDEAMEIINKCKTARQLVKWWMTIYQPACSNVHYDVYSQASRLNWKLFEYIKPHGYNPKNNQSVAQMCFNSYDEPKKPIDLKIMRRELNLWAEYIKPDPDGWKMFSVMEPSLSAGGSYHAYVKGENMRLMFRSSDLMNDKIDKVLQFMADRFKERD